MLEAGADAFGAAASGVTIALFRARAGTSIRCQPRRRA